MKKILVIDDDRETCRFLADLLSEQGWNVATTQRADDALKLSQETKFDLLISDINLNHKLNGIALLKAFKRASPQSQVILISGFGTLETAVEAVREGAFDFISKPFNVKEVITTARRALEHRPTDELQQDAADLLQHYQVSGLIGRSRKMVELYKEIARVAPSRSTVLIVGESGVGKELVARSIHSHSPRSNRAVVAVNCGALAETLLESELFGHVKGSFTGAIADKRGLFEEADGGTIFLDEIGETSPALQVKLLRALQDGEIRRVGSARPMRVDTRVIAATNRDLATEVKEGRFREDLFYRLSVVTLNVPALRDRRDDIPLLATHFLRRACQSVGKQVVLSDGALAALSGYHWPGNVRELENTIEHLVLYSRGEVITEDDLPEKFNAVIPARATRPDSRIVEMFQDLPSLEELEHRYLSYVLSMVGGNRTRAAEILKIDRRTLYRMAERFGMKLDDTEQR